MCRQSAQWVGSVPRPGTCPARFGFPHAVGREPGEYRPGKTRGTGPGGAHQPGRGEHRRLTAGRGEAQSGRVERIDAFQQRHSWLGMPLAVAYKFFDDEAAYLAALLTYYGFLSIFPLMLLLVTALSAVLHNDPGLQQEVVQLALRQFPVIGGQIQSNIHSFRINGLALAAGVLGCLYGGLGVAQAAQHALSTIWGVPRYLRPNPFHSRLKGLSFLVLVTVGLGASTGLSAIASATRAFGADLGEEFRVLAVVLAILLNGSLLLLTYLMLTHREVPIRKLWAVALGGACVWQALQWAGAYYVRHALRGAGRHVRDVRHRAGPDRLDLPGLPYLRRSR